MLKPVYRTSDTVITQSETHFAVVNRVSNTVVAAGEGYHKKTGNLSYDNLEISDALTELAEAAVSNLNIEVKSSDRMHTIPKSVQAEAKRALGWMKEQNRGATPVGMYVSAILAAGGPCVSE